MELDTADTADTAHPLHRHVLVVDDDDGIRTALVYLLRDIGGYEVAEAPDGKPALECLRTSQERMVVLLDLQMPGVDGLAVLEAVAAHEHLATRHAYIMLTAMAGRTLPLTVATLLVELRVPILAKPFDLDDLLDAVRLAQQRLGPDA